MKMIFPRNSGRTGIDQREFFNALIAAKEHRAAPVGSSFFCLQIFLPGVPPGAFACGYFRPRFSARLPA
jgi:hypothetical protein